MESKLQRKIIRHLRLHGWEVHKVMKSSRAGWPDVEAFRNLVTIFIEGKDEGEEAKKLQQYIHRLLKKQGFDVYVIDTWEQYLELKPYEKS